MNNELEKLGKDAQFEVLSRHFCGGTEKTMNNVGHDSWSQGRACEDEAELRITRPQRHMNQTEMRFHDLATFRLIDNARYLSHYSIRLNLKESFVYNTPHGGDAPSVPNEWVKVESAVLLMCDYGHSEHTKQNLRENNSYMHFPLHLLIITST
jgi:hypothetical protein